MTERKAADPVEASDGVASPSRGRRKTAGAVAAARPGCYGATRCRAKGTSRPRVSTVARFTPAPPPRDLMRGTVYIASKDGRVPPSVEALIDERVPRIGFAGNDAARLGEVLAVTERRYLVTGGVVNRTVKIEAMRVGAWPLNSKGAGADWLTHVIASVTDANHNLLIWMKGAAE